MANQQPRPYCFADLDSLAYAAAYSDDMVAVMSHCKKVVGEIKEASKCDYFQGYVENHSGKNNYRLHVAVTLPYKGNRASKPKPRLLGDAKAYLVEYQGCKAVNSMESEDAVSIKVHEKGFNNCTIAAIDKDLWQVPTQHYNYTTKEVRIITQEEAMYYFFTQMITGDSTDNIRGLAKGVGKAAAKKVLAGLEPQHYATAVAAAYRKRGHSYHYLVEQARLLRMLTKVGKPYCYPLSQDEYENLAIGE